MRYDSYKTSKMTTDQIDASLPFISKKEQDICNDSGSDVNSDNIDDHSILPLPSLSQNNSVIHDEFDNEFLRLTTTVRTVYLSYLYKCLLTNYETCYKENDVVASTEVKRCVDQMELHAVQLALETNLYRQHMLRMIADVKSHTIRKKVYKKLVICLETPKNRIDIAIQTDDAWMGFEGTNIQNLFLNNCEKSPEVTLSTSFDNFCERKNPTEDCFCRETNVQELENIAKEKSNNTNEEFKENQINSHTADDEPVRNEDENSQDSLLQHMQDMFCESDDSSDLTRLIEKHSGVTKANVDQEINKICLEADIIASSNLFGASVDNNILKPTVTNVNSNEGKISFSRYKEIRNRKSIKLKENNANGIIENKQKQKVNAIWFVERVHQVSKLKAKMTELSLSNYRRHGRMKEKFLRLFGEFEEEEMMPDSPICIEEHLPACKERIAPWIVKYLMPFYKKRRIKDRQLFKAVAKYITDMLIIKNTFPEQECVSKYIEDYFKNKKFIKTKQDIYL